MSPSLAAVNKKEHSLWCVNFPSPVCVPHQTSLCSMCKQEWSHSPPFPHLLVLWLFADKNKLKEGEIMKMWWGHGRDSDPGILKLTWAAPPLSPLPRSEWWYRLIKNSSLYYEKSGCLHFGRAERQPPMSGLSVALACTIVSGSAKTDVWVSKHNVHTTT